jgi:ribosomal protein S13
MIKVQVENLLPGMQLAKPIMNKAGIVLLSKGTELTETWIRRIQDMELDEVVWVEGKAEMEVPLEEMLAALEKRFHSTQGNKRMDIIKKATEKHIRGLYE